MLENINEKFSLKLEPGSSNKDSIQKKTLAEKNKSIKIFRLFQEALKQLRHIVAN